MNDWNTNTWLMLGGGVFALVVAVLIISPPWCTNVLCEGEPEIVTAEVMKDVASVGSITPLPQDEIDKVDVYVDRSLSMQAFTSAQQSVYRNVLQDLDGLLAGNIRFYGFGFPSEEQGQVAERINPVQLEEASAYTYVNNDYGALFADLQPDSRRTHLVISDGVQSDVDGPRFAEVVSGIGNWIEGGGIFALMAYRAPYEGTYYHESPRPGQVQYSCSDRPFYAFGFFPSVRAKEDLLDILRGSGTAPEHVLTVGQASASIVAKEGGLPPAGRGRGPQVLATYNDHSASSPEIDHVYSGRAVGKGPTTPLRFEVRFDSTAPWTNLSEEEMTRVATSLRPSFQHWRVDTLEVTPSNVFLTPLTDGNAPGIYDAKSIPDDPQNDPLVATLVAPMAYTSGGGRQRVASLLTVGLSPTGANQLIPEDLSTRRDDRSSACSRTLNIQRTIGAVLRDHYVLGRALLVTQW